MAGQPGRSGGAGRKTLDELVRGGTFRPARHAHLLDAPPVNARPEVAAWKPSRTAYRALGMHGRRFVKEMTTACEMNTWEGAVLLDAAAALDERERWHDVIKATPSDTKAARLYLQWHKRHSDLIAQLRPRP